MRTVSIFKIGGNQAIRFPIEFEFDGVSELEITKQDDRIILEPARPSWLSFARFEKADADFMKDCEDVISDEGRISIE